MTLTGMFLIPVGLVLLFMPWRILLVALPSFALLHGAAVVNVGSIGLQPGYMLALFAIARTGLEILLMRQVLNRTALILTAPLAALIVISVLVLWISVAFFTGKITVIGGADGYILENARPYAFRRENLTQISYIVINTMLVYALAHQGARLSPGHLLGVIDKSVILAALLALAVCMWQLVARDSGIYFPDNFLFTNSGYFRADNQAFFGSLRLNGPFSEPAALAYFFSGFVLYCWKRARLQPTVLSTFLVVALVCAIFLSYSTTGYLVLMVLLGIAAFDIACSARRRLQALRVTWRKVVVAGLLLLSIGGATAWVAKDWERLDRILNVSLFKKEETSSFAVRSGSEVMAVRIVAETGGIGIGLGSHKPNSLALTLLSNVGLAGTGAFVLFLAMLLRHRNAQPAAAGRRGPPLDDTPLRFFVIGLLLVHAISNANFNVLMMWVTCGMLAGYHASVRQWTASSRSEMLPSAWSASHSRALFNPERLLLLPRHPTGGVD